MTKQIFIYVTEILGLFCKAAMRWSMSLPQELLFFWSSSQTKEQNPKPKSSSSALFPLRRTQTKSSL